MARKKAIKPTYPRMLIVCEGSKTEPGYFDEIRVSERVTAAHVKVVPSQLGTEPIQVVEYAEQVFRGNNAFDCVFAVFDRDAHLSYNNALAKLQKIDRRYKNDDGKKVPFIAVTSVPCFELWVVLHFRQITHRLTRHDALEQACRFVPGYAKGMTDLYARTKSALPLAETHALQLGQMHNPHGGQDPYTNVTEIMKVFSEIARIRAMS
ncbi:RloB family protein [uncultured Rhodoblastus sp.]|uniref:RloB family protein n=1 Tax=uncultured Rhodoblastus sp. TaxID=543037 RepID=UPI0025FE7B56|nr:RloB family protein [uncultured Rhodoblastus sp.]